MPQTTRPFGHPKARKFIKGNFIPFQMLTVKGHTLQESAELSLVAQALDGKGPLAKSLKDGAKDLVAKFEKSNPEFKFSAFKRDRNKDDSKTKEAKPASKVKPAAPKSKPKAKSAKAKKSEANEPVAVA